MLLEKWMKCLVMHILSPSILSPNLVEVADAFPPSRVDKKNKVPSLGLGRAELLEHHKGFLFWISAFYLQILQ